MQRKVFCFAILAILWLSPHTDASLTSQAAREIAEQVVKKFGKELTGETVETISKKTLELSVKHGDDAAKAVLNTGPRAFRLVSEAGEHGGDVVKLLAKHGDSARLICENPQRLRLFAQYGDDAAEAMIRHGDNAELLIQQYGKSASGALAKVDKQNGRRLIELHNDGELVKIGGADKVLGVVERYGNRGANFIWNNKGALAVGTTALAFYNNPEPFIDGVMELGGAVVDKTGDVIEKVGTEMTKDATGKIVIAVLMLLLVALPTAFIFRRPLWKLFFPKQKI